MPVRNDRQGMWQKQKFFHATFFGSSNLCTWIIGVKVQHKWRLVAVCLVHLKRHLVVINHSLIWHRAVILCDKVISGGSYNPEPRKSAGTVTSLMKYHKYCGMASQQFRKPPTKTDSKRNYLIFWKWAKSRKAYIGLRLCGLGNRTGNMVSRFRGSRKFLFAYAKAVNTLIREVMITKQRMTSFCECRNVQLRLRCLAFAGK